MTIEAMKQWLEALEYYEHRNIEWDYADKQAIKSLRQAIAGAEKQEPVAWSVTRYGVHCNNVFSNKVLAENELQRLDEKYGSEGRTIIPLYTHPQPRKPLITEAMLDAFLEDYEMIGESEDGRDACYTPNENDKALIKDAVFGLLQFADEAAHGIKE